MYNKKLTYINYNLRSMQFSYSAFESYNQNP